MIGNLEGRVLQLNPMHSSRLGGVKRLRHRTIRVAKPYVQNSRLLLILTRTLQRIPPEAVGC